MRKKILFVVGILFNLSFVTQAQWVNQSSGFTTVARGIYGISIVNSNVVWAIEFDSSFTATVNEFTRTINGGTTWTPGTIIGTTGLNVVSISAVNKDTAWVAMANYNNGGGGIYKTTNGGTSWVHQTTATFAAPAGYPDLIHFFNANNGVCVGDSNSGTWEIYTTANGGTNWTRVTSGNIPANLPNEYGNVAVFSVVGNTIWFGTDQGRVYKSTNMGATWTVANSNLTDLREIAFKDANNGIASDGGILKKTIDGGSAWTPLNYTGMFFDADVCYVPGTTGTYVNTGWFTGNAGSSYSKDDGATWTTIDAVEHTVVAFLNSTTGWSGGFNASSTVGGMFKWSGNLLSGINDLDLNSFKTNLYPNPVSNNATISVEGDISNLRNIQITIYDILGNEVMKIENIAGNKINFDKGDLNKGAYIYQLMNSKGNIGSGRFVIN